MSLVEVKNLTKKFAKTKALSNISLNIKEKKITGLVGPDGAGKTTLIRLLTGLLDLDEGELTVLNYNLPRDAFKVQEQIGYMPQKFGLYEDLTVLENLRLYANLQSIEKKEQENRIEELLKFINLKEFTSFLARDLSGGMKQKLGLACALIKKPKLLLLDEPGVGITFSQLIIEWSNNSLLLALILVALASLILGMGLPVTASYVVLSVLCAPALVGLMLSPEMAALVNAGIEIPEVAIYLLAAHLIIFWLSQDSNLTPPVCLAAFAAAAIAKTPPMRTGFMAWKVGKGMYIVPLLFAFTPLVTGTFWEQIEIFVFAIFGILTFAIAIEGFWDKKTNIVERVIFALSSILLLAPDSMIGYETIIEPFQNNHIIGIFLFIFVMSYHKISYKKSLEKELNGKIA